MTKEVAQLHIMDAESCIKNAIDRTPITESALQFLVRDLRLYVDRIESYSHQL